MLEINGLKEMKVYADTNENFPQTIITFDA